MNTNGERAGTAGSFAEIIAKLRVEKGLTQAALAQQLGVTHQAVSQWECGDTMPDILLLPKLADILDTSIDLLFGRAAKEGGVPSYEIALEDVPKADGKLRVVLFLGDKMVKSQKVNKLGETRVIFEYRGPALKVESEVSVQCGDVEGDVSAGASVTCCNVGGDVTAGATITCGDVGGDADAGNTINCNEIHGDADAGNTITVKGNVGGDVDAGYSVTVGGSVGGDVESVITKRN